MDENKYTEEFTEELDREEEKQSETDDYAEVPPSDIVAFNELRSCADLVRMYKTKQLEIQPDFQRDVVWSKASQTRFIDSLIKQLPIPSMCVSLDYKTGKRLMIDGLQRISSIIYFLTDDKWKLSVLEDIEKTISGKTVEQIKNKNYELYSRLENLTIPITVLRCDYSKKSHMHYLFTIFHRLNTGGNKLNNQEIRNCIFYGDFNNLLKGLTRYTNFQKLFEIDPEKTYRFTYEEIILRFLALNESYETYPGKLAKYLNDYMDDKRSITEAELAEKRHLFERVIDLIYLRILDRQPMPKLSKATMEGIMVGISRNINALENKTDIELRQKLAELRADENYSVDNLKEGLSAKEKVVNRLNRAVEIFNF
jgi:predicted PolB exonuclease-like 3'-5' exonuclease